VESSQRDREREEELALFREWKTAKSKRRREAALLKLCERSEAALGNALKHLATKYSDRQDENIAPHEWLKIHGMTRAEVSQIVVLAVVEAGRTFDPERAKGNNRFTTYTRNFIVGKLSSTASVRDPLNHAHAGFNESTFDEYIQTTLAWKKSSEGRQSIPAGFSAIDQEECADDLLRYLVELPTNDGGFGKVNSLAQCLRTLSVDVLGQLRDWLEENQQHAVELYGRNRLHYLYLLVRFEVWSKQLPPNVRHANLFADKRGDALPLRGVAIRTDGKAWDLTNPIHAMILEQQGKGQRQIAKLLAMPWSTYKDMRRRMKERGLSLSEFTPDDLDATARGEQGKRSKS
jgi:hypothetical protein